MDFQMSFLYRCHRGFSILLVSILKVAKALALSCESFLFPRFAGNLYRQQIPGTHLWSVKKLILPHFSTKIYLRASIIADDYLNAPCESSRVPKTPHRLLV